MFEQALMPTTRNKPWTLGASLTLQCALVGSMVLYSALHVDVLPPNTMRHIIEFPTPPAPPPPAIKIIGAILERHASSLTMTPRPFTEPSTIPSKIAMIDDVDAGAPAAAPTIAGVVGGMGSPNGMIGGLGIPTTIAPPPPPTHAQPAAKPTTPIRLTSTMMEAKILKRVIPIYPSLAKQARISGKVHLMSVIAKDGTIQKLEVLDGHPLLIAAAIDAVKQWIYRPTMLNGEPVDVIAPIEINFTLTQ